MRILDLFCGAGGAAMGLHQAGFEVVGVDIKPQPHYPFEFHQGDALTYPLEGFDAIWASPPCQAYSFASALARKQGIVYPDLVDEVRQRLYASGKPFICENVPQSPLRNWVMLCGTMFNLRTYRHRHFEANFPIMCPGHPRHVVPSANKHRKEAWENGWMLAVTGDAGVTLPSIALGIDWMNGNELSQAIPPAYSRFIGEQLRKVL